MKGVADLSSEILLGTDRIGQCPDSRINVFLDALLTHLTEPPGETFNVSSKEYKTPDAKPLKDNFSGLAKKYPGDQRVFRADETNMTFFYKSSGYLSEINDNDLRVLDKVLHKCMVTIE